MAMIKALLIATCCVFARSVNVSDVTGEVQLNVPWEAFLHRADPVFEWNSTELPNKWYESAFIGNGKLGMMIFAIDASTLRLTVGSSAVWDDRGLDNPYHTVNRDNFACDRPRLPIGSFTLKYSGELKSGSMRMGLYNGIVTGGINTTTGTVAFQAFANADYRTADVIGIETITMGDIDAALEWAPEDAISTWASRCEGYVNNPDPLQALMSGVNVTTQAHLSGKSHATAFASQTMGSSTITYIAVSSTSMNANETAVGEVKKAMNAGWQHLLSAHSQWWNEYYLQSFITLSESYIESFYWVNMYKLASGTRGDRTLYDLQGPWYVDGTSWPDLHWDLNLQLTYWPMFTSNRLDLAKSLVEYMKAATPGFISNVPAQFQNDSAGAPTGASSLVGLETCYWNYGPDCLTTSPSVTGNLLWTMQVAYQMYEFSLDEEMLRNDIFPLLRRAVNYHGHLENITGEVRHLVTTFSPEYSAAPDCNYDVSLYRWGLQTIIHVCDVLAIDDPNLGKWKESLAHLVEYPSGPDGFMIGTDVPLAHGHRHFSHLMMIFPLRLLNFSDPTDVEKSKVSIDHWLGFPTGYTGFCRTAASSMNVVLDRIPQAYSNLTYLLDDYILPNTMYHEGENGACGETPPAASSAIQDWMLMEWNNVVHVFPGISDADITDASFYHLRAPGAFLVSAKRSHKVTQFVEVYSEQGAPLVISTDMIPPLVAQPSSVAVTQLTDGSFAVTLKKNETVVLYSSHGAKPDLVIEPSAGQADQFNWWGFPKGTK